MILHERIRELDGIEGGLNLKEAIVEALRDVVLLACASERTKSLLRRKDEKEIAQRKIKGQKPS